MQMLDRVWPLQLLPGLTSALENPAKPEDWLGPSTLCERETLSCPTSGKYEVW